MGWSSFPPQWSQVLSLHQTRRVTGGVGHGARIGGGNRSGRKAANWALPSRNCLQLCCQQQCGVKGGVAAKCWAIVTTKQSPTWFGADLARTPS